MRKEDESLSRCSLNRKVTPTRRQTVLPESKLFLVAVVGCSLLAGVSRARETNVILFAPATRLEAFETNIGILIIKGTTEVGTVSANAGLISVKCRENTDTSNGHKERGLAIEITQSGQRKDRMLIDYDELAPLLKGLDYLSKLDPTISSLDSFDAGYNTKGGFRVAALGNRRSGSVQFAVRDIRQDLGPVLLSRQEMGRFYTLVEEAKKQLDALDQKQ